MAHLGPEDARSHLIAQIAVNHVDVARAKTAILARPSLDDQHPPHTTALVEEIAISLAGPKPGELVLHESADVEGQIAQAARYLSMWLATAEGLRDLTSRGSLIWGGTWQFHHPNMTYTTVYQRSSGSSGGVSLEELRIGLPDTVARSPLARTKQSPPVSLLDAGLFAQDAGMANADKEVLEALDDAVEALRSGLYRASVVLLGKVAEGAIAELGIALSDVISSEARAKFLASVDNPGKGAAALAGECEKVCQNPALSALMKQASYSQFDRQALFAWASLMREARNAIHYGVRPTLPNTYEKAAILFIEAASVLKPTYALRDAALEFGASPSPA